MTTSSRVTDRSDNLAMLTNMRQPITRFSRLTSIFSWKTCGKNLPDKQFIKIFREILDSCHKQQRCFV